MKAFFFATPPLTTYKGEGSETFPHRGTVIIKMYHPQHYVIIGNERSRYPFENEHSRWALRWSEDTRTGGENIAGLTIASLSVLRRCVNEHYPENAAKIHREKSFKTVQKCSNL